jgi:hypothetical protein
MRGREGANISMARDHVVSSGSSEGAVIAIQQPEYLKIFGVAVPELYIAL